MSLPGFTAATSLYQTTNSYRSGFFADLPTTRISPAMTCGTTEAHETCKWITELRYADCIEHCDFETLFHSSPARQAARQEYCHSDCATFRQYHQNQCDFSGGCPKGLCCGGKCCTLGACCRGRCQPPCSVQQTWDPITCECKNPCPPGTQTCPSGGPICFQIPECPGGKIWTKDCRCACPPEFFECGGNCMHELERLCPPKMHFSASKCTCIYSDPCNCGALGNKCGSFQRCIEGACEDCPASERWKTCRRPDGLEGLCPCNSTCLYEHGGINCGPTCQ
jgi:hypothetical protein